MFLEAFEDALDLVEDNNERIAARNNALCRLYGSRMSPLEACEIQAIATERRTEAPAKMTFAGENT